MKYRIYTSDAGEETVSITHVVHTIRMGDVEDPDLMIAQPIWEWQQTDAGKWIMENSNPAPQLHLNPQILNINDFTMSDIDLRRYTFHPSIKAEMAV